MLTPFKCLKFVKSFACTYSSHSSHFTLFQKKPPKNRFEDMELTAGGSYSMWYSWSKLEKEWNLHRSSTKTPQSLGVFYFGLGVFKGCNALLWKLNCYDLRVFQNFQDKSNFSGVFKKTFPQPSCLFLFLEQTTDRKIDLLFLVLRHPAQCTGLELLPEPLQNKICYRLHPKCTPFSCFPIIYSSAM